MASVNKVILVGNCGRDPEVRYLPSGQAVANVSIATTSRRKDQQSGEVIEDTQWHRLTFYDRVAEIVGEYVKKGHPIYVEGRIKYGKYTDNNGVERNTCDIVVSQVQLLGGGQRDGDGRVEGRGSGGGQQRGNQHGNGGGQQRQGGNYGQQRGYGGGQNQSPGQRARTAQQDQQRQAPSQQQQPAAPGGGSGFDDFPDDDIPF